jgi:hypothetical protein
MKTIPLYLFLSSSISLSVFSQEKAETRFQGQKLNGRVKTLTENRYDVEKKFLHNHLSKPETAELYLFDCIGNVTECLGISTDDSSSSKIFRYGFDGKETLWGICNVIFKVNYSLKFSSNTMNMAIVWN